MHTDDMARRARSFERGAAAYDRLRPEFPTELFVDIADHAGHRMQGRVLEIGAGTGRATLPLARSGVHVEVVEPSQDMLDVLAARLDDAGLTDRARLRRAGFEDVAETERFDVVVAAQSFHWADPDTRWRRLGSILRPDGRAFLFWNGWRLAPSTCDLTAVADLYDRLGDGLIPDIGDPESVPGWAETEIADRPDLEVIAADTYSWPWRLSIEDYLALLATTSQYAVAPSGVRDRIFDGLRGLLGPTVDLDGETLCLTVGPSRD